MPALTRRNDDPHREGWHVHCTDVRVGWIGVRTGIPKTGDQLRVFIPALSQANTGKALASISKPHARASNWRGRLSCRKSHPTPSTNGGAPGPSTSGKGGCGRPAADCRRKSSPADRAATAAPRSTYPASIAMSATLTCNARPLRSATRRHLKTNGRSRRSRLRQLASLVVFDFGCQLERVVFDNAMNGSSIYRKVMSENPISAPQRRKNSKGAGNACGKKCSMTIT